MAERDLMSWDQCLKEFIKGTSRDKDRAESLLKTAALRNDFWANLKFDAKYTSIAVDGYYEVIKELLTALLYLEGYRLENHECLIAYLKQKHPELLYEVGVVYQLKRIRNDTDYKGFFVNSEYLERNNLEFRHIIETLQKLVRQKLNE